MECKRVSYLLSCLLLSRPILYIYVKAHLGEKEGGRSEFSFVLSMILVLLFWAII